MATPSFEYPINNVEPGSALAMIAAHNSRSTPSEDCFAIKVTSDRMEPYLRVGDWVMVDPQDRAIIDAIYAIDPPEGETTIVRIQHCGEGMVRVFGDNLNYLPQYLSVDTVRLLIAGRVRYICKRV